MGIGQDDHQVLVVEADAALAVAGADAVVALRAGAVDTDILESGRIEINEVGTIGLDGAESVVVVILDALDVLDVRDGENALRGLAVAAFGLLAEVLADGDLSAVSNGCVPE